MFSPTPLKQLIMLSLCSALAWSVTACSDDTNNGQGNNPVTCPPGQSPNPITGACSGFNRPDISVPGGDSTSDLSEDSGPDLPPDMPATIVDVPPADECSNTLDSDSDGLKNGCECQLGTNPGNSDSDSDGLPDGFEDANRNCRKDTRETDPTQADTDSDGVDDGTELRNGLNPRTRDSDQDGLSDGVEFNVECLDPLSRDTDNDGLADGEEDLNKDGRIGICSENPRMYAPECAQGEYDPCKADTDGDGTPDNEAVSFLGCRPEFLNNPPPTTLIKNVTGDYQLALVDGVTTVVAQGMGQGNGDLFNHAPKSYAGFVSQLVRPNGANSTESLRNAMIARLSAAFPSAVLEESGRGTFTHDGHNALVGIKVNLGANGKPDTVRSTILSGLSGGNISNNAGGNFTASVSPLSFVFTVVDRGGANFVLTGAVVSGALHDSPTSDSAYLVDDAISANALANSSLMLEPGCVSYRVSDQSQVDFIWVIDGSGSMSDENADVRRYAADFAGILNASNLDWRLGVVSSSCFDIQDDNTLPANVRALYGDDCKNVEPPFPLPFPITPFKYQNGELCSKDDAFFTTDVEKFKACVSDIAPSGFDTSIITEHTGTIAAAAVARALPRAQNDNKKLRPNAATVIISVTDEFDDYYEGKLGWADAGSGDNPPNDPSSTTNSMTLDSFVNPFVNYLLSPDARATMFGIFWVPMQACSGASEAAVGIQRMVDRTGGSSGSICSGALDATLQLIAQASAGLASGLRLEGAPVSPSIKVRLGDVSTQMLELPARGRQQGWDYDAVTNAVLFAGSNAPQTSDRVVISYQRWEGSVQVCTSNAECSGISKGQCIDGKCR